MCWRTSDNCGDKIVENKKLDQDGNIIEYESKKEVKKIGDGGHITLPKGLIGKLVNIFYKK